LLGLVVAAAQGSVILRKTQDAERRRWITVERCQPGSPSETAS